MKYLLWLRFICLFAIYPLAFAIIAGCEPAKTRVVDAYEWESVCVDGVEYIVRGIGRRGYASVKFNRDSTVVTCVN